MSVSDTKSHHGTGTSLTPIGVLVPKWGLSKCETTDRRVDRAAAGTTGPGLIGGLPRDNSADTLRPRDAASLVVSVRTTLKDMRFEGRKPGIAGLPSQWDWRILSDK